MAETSVFADAHARRFSSHSLCSGTHFIQELLCRSVSISWRFHHIALFPCAVKEMSYNDKAFYAGRKLLSFLAQQASQANHEH
jgi:hypothetical protein